MQRQSGEALSLMQKGERSAAELRRLLRDPNLSVALREKIERVLDLGERQKMLRNSQKGAAPKPKEDAAPANRVEK